MRCRILLLLVVITALSGCEFFLRLNPTWGEGDAQLFLMAAGGAAGDIYDLDETVDGSVTTTAGATADGKVAITRVVTVQSAALTTSSTTVTLTNYYKDFDAEGGMTISGVLKVEAEEGPEVKDYTITGSFTVDSEEIVFTTAVIDMDLSLDLGSRDVVSQEGSLETDVKTFDITTIMDFETIRPDENWMGSVL